VRGWWFFVIGCVACGVTNSQPRTRFVEPIAGPVAPAVAQTAPASQPPRRAAETRSRAELPVARGPYYPGGAPLDRDPVIVMMDRRNRAIDQAVNVAEIDFLGRCARAYVRAQPAGVRRVLVEALSRYITRCESNRIVLDRPLGFGSHDRRSRSDIAFVGTLEPHGAGMALRVKSCGATRSYDRVTVVGDDGEWTSPRVELVHDASGCDVAELPYTRALARAIRNAADSATVAPVVRFEGADLELELAESTREELRSVLDAIDAISEL